MDTVKVQWRGAEPDSLTGSTRYNAMKSNNDKGLGQRESHTMKRLLAILILLLIGSGLPTVAQESVPSLGSSADEQKPPDWLDGIDVDAFGAADGGDIVLTGELKIERGGRDGVLEIKAVISPKWHTYAVISRVGQVRRRLR
jgi:hypothetical protein